MSLLTTGNPKLVKGQRLGYLSFVLHLAPAKLSGFNVCPMASKGCAAACLNTAGRGQMSKIQKSRIAKTQRFFNDRDGFVAQLVKDIQAAERKAKRMGLIPVIRLNGTSDIRWETTGIIQKFPHIQHYDYTKISNRRNIPANYNLTFSRCENNDDKIAEAIADGMNVAVVFSTKKGDNLPIEYMGYTVVDGDETDLRFLDPKGVIVGLRAKGKARHDTSGFVVQV